MITLLTACSSVSLYEYKLAGEEESTVPAGAVQIGSDGVELPGFIDPMAEAAKDEPEIMQGDIAYAYTERISVAALQLTGDLSFLDAVELYVAAPGLPEMLIASTSDALAGRGPIELELVDLDLAPYLSTGDASFPARAWGEAPPQDMTLYVEWALALGVTAQGIAAASDAL